MFLSKSACFMCKNLIWFVLLQYMYLSCRKIQNYVLHGSCNLGSIFSRFQWIKYLSNLTIILSIIIFPSCSICSPSNPIKKKITTAFRSSLMVIAYCIILQLVTFFVFPVNMSLFDEKSRSQTSDVNYFSTSLAAGELRKWR